MKSVSIFSILILFSIISVVSLSPSAFADHHAVTVSTPEGTSVPGCETTNECYIPYEVTIDVGGMVTWSNDDTAAHTVTGGGAADGPSGVFDSSLFMAGTTFSHTFEEAGEYPYFCMVHPWMEGIVIVQEAGMMEEAGEAMDEMMEDAGEAMEEAAETTGEMAEDAVEATGEAMEDAGEAMEEAAETTGEMAEDAVEATGEAMEDAGEAMQEAVTDEEEGGGCLIATAAYGTELAPQVQFLREIRDNTVMSTQSGAAFMTGFNNLYYSFSPTIADIERENPVFQEAVKLFITPMISTLSIMTLADQGSETEVLGLGISVIALNLGMYFVAPATVAFTIRKRLKSKN
ncbi:MAG: plastocyanin/azurin family copper-binding protein [Nitrosopumilus sp.]|nr:plastocyanin/azurin family copper-binding protein [Nitrosopumilus sp.]